MPVAHNSTSRWATVLTTLLVLVQLVHLLDGGHDTYVDVLLLTLVVATAVASVQLHRDNSLEARLAVAFFAALSGGGMLVTLTVGLPGRDVTGLGPLEGVTLFLSVAVLGLLAAGRPWRATRRVDQPGRGIQSQRESPYAS